jgi:hypothetical protein
VGKGSDGPAEEIEERCRAEIKKSIPLAASLGQMILFENVWNQMMYDHDKGPEQTADRFIKFVDSFNSPWVGMYYDIGNHWKYGQPREWLKAFGRRAVKLDIKFEVDEVKPLSDKWAMARTRSKFTVKVGDAQPHPDANQELFVFQKGDDGKWRIARYSYSSTNPAKK